MVGSCKACGRREWARLRWYTCPRCGRDGLCGTCIDNPVIVHEEEGGARDTGSGGGGGGGGKSRVTSMCRSCMEEASTLDFSSSVDVFGPAAGSAPAIVFAHGGGGCRLMYRYQARQLASRGFRCVLLDLPAHGALLDEELTIDTACARIAAVTREHAPSFRGVAPAYVGGSLGGYLGMELLGREPQLFSCAVISCASQTVGVGAGCKARFALVAMGAAIGRLYGETIVGQMLTVLSSRKELRQDLLAEAMLGPSMFFQHGEQHVKVLQQTNPVDAIAHFRGPILFADGSLDHHDNRERLLAVARASDSRSRAVVYEGGDHFFSHDSRFCEQHIDDIDHFLRSISAPVTPGP